MASGETLTTPRISDATPGAPEQDGDSPPSPHADAEPLAAPPPGVERSDGEHSAPGSDAATATPADPAASAPKTSPEAGAAPAALTAAASADADDADDVALGLTAGDRAVSALLAAACLILLCVHWARLTGWGAQPVELERHQPQTFLHHLDVNTANWVELSQLEDIGDVLARRIVEDRTRRGPFPTVDALRRVQGIGPKTLEKLRPWIRASSGDP
jgi:competence ComEA-like helix-hairpin-helix protein